MNRRQKIIVSATGIFLVLLILVGLTYAYFLTQIQGNEEEKSITITTANLKLEYIDGTATLSTNGPIMPGFTASKEFKVKNSGNTTTSYSVVIDNVENTFNRTEDWTYTLTLNGTEISSGVVPDRTTYIYNNIEIAQEEIDELKLDIVYADLKDVNQSEDMNKEMSFKVDIRSGITMFDNANEGTLLSLIGRDNKVQEPLTEIGSYSAYKYELITYDDALAATQEELGYDSKYYTYGTDYTFDELTGKLTLINTKVGKLKDISKPGVYINYTGSTTSEINENVTSNIIYVTRETNGTIYFDAIHFYNTIQEKTFARTEDDYGYSYYYRGNVENNFVNYSGMCWRIVRVDGNGNIKLILADGNNECNNENYSLNSMNGFPNSTKYTDSTYITFSKEHALFKNSKLPNVLKTWSERTEKTLDTTELVLDAKWCNDTSIATETTTIIAYGAERNKGNYTLKCNMVGKNNSAATIYENIIGILSIDEVAYSGYGETDIIGSYLKEFPYLFYNCEEFWTMTPGYIEEQVANQWYYNTFYYPGDIGVLRGLPSGDVQSGNVRPSILIKSTALATTNENTSLYGEPGTYTNPYVIN